MGPFREQALNALVRIATALERIAAIHERASGASLLGHPVTQWPPGPSRDLTFQTISHGIAAQTYNGSPTSMSSVALQSGPCGLNVAE